MGGKIGTGEQDWAHLRRVRFDVTGAVGCAPQ